MPLLMVCVSIKVVSLPLKLLKDYNTVYLPVLFSSKIKSSFEKRGKRVLSLLTNGSGHSCLCPRQEPRRHLGNASCRALVTQGGSSADTVP